MIYPFIYTRTKYHDYRILTTKSLKNLPREIMILSRSIARAMIDVDNDYLKEPTWVLVKTDDYILWGISCLNCLLSHKSNDKTNRPVRGFFGIIAVTSSTHILPLDTDYFKQLYAKYVNPIWESLNDSEEIEVESVTIPCENYIYPSEQTSIINLDQSICRIQPYTKEVLDLLSEVFGSESDNSIALNVYDKRQIIDIGVNRFSFMNIVMAENSIIPKTENITLQPYIINTSLKGSSSTESYHYKQLGLSENAKQIENEDFAHSETRRKRNIIKYCIYFALILFCLFLLFKGSIIWDRLLNGGKTSNDNDSIVPTELTVNKPSHCGTIIQYYDNHGSNIINKNKTLTR